MKRIFKIFIVSLFSLFSFYYTDKIVELSKKNDPIMKDIINDSAFKYVAPVNGVISNGTIIIGKSGRKVDINSSYEQMKKLNKYNAAFLEYTSIKPIITKNKNYDKYIVGSSNYDNKIAIVFRTNDIDLIKQIVYILGNNTYATFYVDGLVIEKNRFYFESLGGNIALGIYSYNDTYDIVSVKYVKRLLKKLSFTEYCLYKNSSFLDSCKYFRINTVKPILIEKDLYNYIKNNKKSGLIYEIKPTTNNIKELNSTFIYLKQKGYEMIKLSDLLSE